MSMNEWSEELEESHYYHTIGDIVNLMLTYGAVKVVKDITERIQEVYDKESTGDVSW